MVLEDSVQRSGKKLLQRIREHGEPKVRGFVSERLMAVARERAIALEDVHRRSDEDRQHAVQQETARVWAEAERTRVAEIAALEARVAARSETDAVLTRLAQGIRRLDDASSLTDLLDTLTTVMGEEAPRAGVLLVRGERVAGWRFVGFGAALGAASQIDLACGEAGIVGHAVMSGESHAVTAAVDGVSDDAAPGFVSLALGVKAQATPVTVDGRVVAVLYADNTGGAPSPGLSATVEILARHAGHCLEAVTVARTARLRQLAAAGELKADESKLPFEEDSH